MSKLTQQEEKELIAFIKDWLKTLGFNQKDLASELNLKSSRTSEINLKVKELYKKGGIFNIVKNLIKVEQNWLKNIEKASHDSNNSYPITQLDINSQDSNDPSSFNQLDIDSLVNQIQKDSSK